MISEEKICPRCNQIFICDPGNIQHCQCNDICLSAAVKEKISEEYEDCLCIKCLVELNEDKS